MSVVKMKDDAIEIIRNPFVFRELIEKYMGFDSLLYYDSILDEYEMLIEELEEILKTNDIQI